jgi:tRNA dimethylallyltransferase
MHSWPIMVESMSATSSRFAGAARRLDDDIDAFPALSGPARGAGIGRRSARSAASPSSIQRSKPRGDLPQQAEAPRSSSLSSSRPAAISVAMAKRASSRRPHRRSDRQRQVGAGAGAGRATGGVIVNADSAQLYRDLPILSPRPPPSDRRRAEHRLYGVRDGAEPCSAADWAALAQGARSPRLHAQRPAADPGRRHRALSAHPARRHRAGAGDRSRNPRRGARGDVAENLRALTALDPEAAARLNPGDTTRIARALEVVKSTGRTLAEWQEQREGGIGDEIELAADPAPAARLALRALRPSASRRWSSKARSAEVEALLARKLDPELPVMRAIGVRELGALSARRDSTASRRSPPASRRRAATPSANIPGSRTSRRPTGRASPSRSKAMR